ncbi:Oidioi.mRNA.OKI2018_I69.PAR.g8574.t1.cds [Oikopleura dioica]|uniref:Oidioi.mRNA.OKI2018_I69.PAR.g8574.t1.cds n=1 Tax=Oikopleura dioica TaxID=34765 RepID=A0ABN7RKL6_OIKDI|nr:Oidioi.mRNA.OKI2018_I69.PAR.g8574.t1.cds [Oikopleura dioica]
MDKPRRRKSNEKKVFLAFCGFVIFVFIGYSYLYYEVACDSTACKLSCGNIHLQPIIQDLSHDNGKTVNRIFVNGETFIVKSSFSSRPDPLKREKLKRELEILEKQILYGQPEVLNTCFKGEELLYVLSDVGGDPVCSDEFGTNDECFRLEELQEALVSEVKVHDDEVERNIWRSIQSFAELFLQLEDNNLYIDDISGSNFVLNENYQAHLVDLDSLQEEFEQRKCEKHSDCVSSSDYHSKNSLFYKIHQSCDEFENRCQQNLCTKNAALHTCGFGNWILTGLSNIGEELDFFDELKEIRSCSTAALADRCSFEDIKFTTQDVLKQI